MDACCKEGFLQKAGKRSFQAWRKRWFVLDGDNLRYYSPAAEYNDTNLLGSISMFEIQSVAPSKSVKHGFDIMTRSRTYNVSAKSDLDRDDWMIILRKASNSKKRLDGKGSLVDQNQIYSEIAAVPSAGVVTTGDSGNTYDYLVATSNNSKEKKNKSSSKKKGTKEQPSTKLNSVYESPVDQKDANDGKIYSTCSQIYEDPMDKRESTIDKRRSNTCIEEGSDKLTELKPRASSDLNPVLNNIRANSMLRKMSTESDTDGDENKGENGTSGLYQELDERLDECYSGEEEEDDDAAHVPQNGVNLTFPSPKGEGYAFEEIAKLLGDNLEALQQSCNIEDIAVKCNSPIDKSEEFPAITLLKQMIEQKS